MANILYLSALTEGVQRQVNLSQNILEIGGLQLDGSYNSHTGHIIHEAAQSGNTTSYTVYWPTAQGAASTYLQNDGSGNLSWGTAGGGSVTTVSVVSTNGFAGTVANATSTPAITIETTITAALLAGNGTALSAAALATNEIYVGNGSNLPVAVAMSGDASIVSSGALTLATVNSNTGTFGSSTSIPSFTVNAKGLITAASGNAVVAPAGTLSGATLNSTVTASSLTSLGTQAQALNMGTNQINNLAMAGSPASTDATNVSYVQTQISNAINGLTWKGPVQAYASSNIALTGGATLTIDSYSVQNGNYVILANQTTASQNYVYVASGIGTAYTLTEVTGSEAPTAIGDAYLIEKGTVYGNTAFQVNAISPNVTFIQFAGPNTYTFTSPLLLTGNTVSIGYDNSTIGDNGSNQLYVLSGGIGTTQLASNSVTYAKLQQVAASSLVGNPTGSLANAEGITLGATLTFSSAVLETVALSGDVTTSANSFATSLVATSNATLTTLSALTTASSLASVGTITSGTWNATAIAIAHGGTGQTTAASAFNALAPATSTGGLILATGTNTYGNLAIGSTGNVLTVSGGTAVWAAPATSGTVTTVSVVSTNGFAGTVANASSTPAITIETTLNTPVIAGNGTAITAATTTGTGSTVVLNASPTLTGTITAASLTLSGGLIAPTTEVTATYGGAATLSANTTYALRWGMPANSETANKLYVADWNTSSYDLFWAVGLYNSTSSTPTSTVVTVITKGTLTLGSSDTTFGSSDQGRPVYLGSSGAFTPYSTFSPSSGDANMKLGIAQSSSAIWVDLQMMGVS